MVGWGVYRSETLLYTQIALQSGPSTGRWMSVALGQTKTRPPSTEGGILQDVIFLPACPTAHQPL